MDKVDNRKKVNKKTSHFDAVQTSQREDNTLLSKEEAVNGPKLRLFVREDDDEE